MTSFTLANPQAIELVPNRSERIQQALNHLSVQSQESHSPSCLVNDPTTNQPIIRVPYMTLNEIDQQISQISECQSRWSALSAIQRRLILHDVTQALQTHQSYLADLITAEVGKTMSEAQGEVQEVIDVFMKLDELVDQAGGDQPYYYYSAPSKEPGREAYSVYQQRKPHEVVLIIPAFNFPVAVPGWGIAPALLAGCGILVAPSPRTPLAMMGQANVIKQALAPHGFYELIAVCLPTNSDKLILSQHPSIGCIQFTGSTAMGQTYLSHIHSAHFYKDVILELGGNNAVVVDSFDSNDTSYITKLVTDIAFGASGTAGQRCTSTRRLFLHERIASVVTDALVEFYKHRLVIGDPFDPNVNVQPLISSDAVTMAINRVATLTSTSTGGHCLIGGHAIPADGHFFVPALITNASLSAVTNECFAPILSIHSFTSIETVLEHINSTRHGLSLGIYGDIDCFDFFRSHANVGIINHYTGTSGAEAGFDNVFGGHGLTGGKPGMLGPMAIHTYCKPVTNGVIGDTKPTQNAQGVRF